MAKAFILMGISGSGKSTFTEKNFSRPLICSTDDYPRLYVGKEFHPELLPAAHQWTLRNFIWECQNCDADDCIVVDNTNTSMAEIAPYVAVAQAYGVEVEITHIKCNTVSEVETAAARNAHGVPFAGVFAQWTRIENLLKQLPPWWPLREVDARL